MIDTLRSLAEADLRALAANLRAGRLAFPPSTMALQTFCASGDAPVLARTLAELASQGMSADHVALVLGAIAAERAASRPATGELVDLVWTGPEAPGTASRDTGAVVRELFRTATTEVLIAGYAVYQGRSVFAALSERMETLPDFRVRMFLDISRPHGDTSLDSEIRNRFAHRFRTQEWPGSRLPEIYYDPRALATDTKKRATLHAKCIVVDRRLAFVSSANFTEAAQARNIEVGTLIRSASFAETLASHFTQLVACGGLVRLDIPGGRS